MNNTNATYKAFSLVEVMVVLLLSGIVVSLAYAGLTYFSKQSKQYRDKQELIGTHQQFISQFHSDWWKAEAVNVSGNSITLSSDSRKIIYRLSSESVSRSLNGISSDFSISATISETHRNELNYIDFISIEIDYKDEILLLNEYKQYYPSLFLN